jgi:hypothetical protein
VHIRGWENHLFFRLKNPGSDGEDFIVHKYPFRSLPLLRSHLRPQFVIFDSGRKLKNLKAAVLKKLADDIPSLLKVVQLYSAWMEPPEEEKQGEQDEDLSYQPLVVESLSSDSGGFVDDEKDTDYEPNSRDGRRSKKRKLSRQTGIKGKRKKKVPSNRKEHLLSEITLSRLNKRFGRASWTSDRIREWSFAKKIRI